MNQFTRLAGIDYPIIGGPMYPCSNPELVAAISEAGALGVVQPISLTYVHGYEFNQGIDYIRSLTDKPIGFNALIEKSSRRHLHRMSGWIDMALDQGIRFFITSLGKPDWVVKRVHAYGGVVFHDASEKKWAQIGSDCGVDGLICVNNRAGGHCGFQSAQQLYQDCLEFNKPMVCAGGIATATDVKQMLDLGYQACQLGTRFIATDECRVSEGYKQAIVDASEDDIVLTEKMTGIPVSIIRFGVARQQPLKPVGLIAWMLRSRYFKRFARTYLALNTMSRLKKDIQSGDTLPRDWMAGKSAGGIHQVQSVAETIQALIKF